MTELEQYLNAKGISVNIDEEDIEFEVRFRRIVEKSCAIFENQAIQLSGTIMENIFFPIWKYIKLTGKYDMFLLFMLHHTSDLL